MTLQSKRELDVTRDKLLGLEQVYSATQAAPTENAYADELTLRSLMHAINRLKEEMTRYESRTGTVAPIE